MKIFVNDKSNGLQSVTVYRHITAGKNHKLNLMSNEELLRVIANGGFAW